MNILESIAGLTKDNGAVKDLKDLLVLANFTDEKLEKFFTFKQNVQNGGKLGFIGEMEAIGWEGAGCSPEYKNANVAAAEKTWNLGDWQVPLKWCYEDFLNTVAEVALKHGTEIGDLTSTDIMAYVIEPALSAAINKMYWRHIWFGDKDAANVAEGGVITDGVDKSLFTVCDGFFKQLFAIGAANATQRVTISANNESTRAAQFTKIKEAGVAINIFDSLIENADPRIASLEGAGIFCTKSLADALQHDLRATYKDNMSWEQIASGIDMTEYNGVKIYRVAIWDRLIQQFQNNGTKLNLPHRAVFTSPKQLFVGSPANEAISELDVWFNKDERTTKAYSAGRIGCLLGEDELFQIAY